MVLKYLSSLLPQRTNQSKADKRNELCNVSKMHSL